jgi:hypothetical protein
MIWSDVLAELVGLVGSRVGLTLSFADSTATAVIYGTLTAGPQVQDGEFYIYVDGGSGVRVSEGSFVSAAWTDGPVGRELAVGFGDALLGIKPQAETAV